MIKTEKEVDEEREIMMKGDRESDGRGERYRK
jgi:hypothetical protein